MSDTAMNRLLAQLPHRLLSKFFQFVIRNQHSQIPGDYTADSSVKYKTLENYHLYGTLAV